METLIRRHIMWRLIWVCTVCLCTPFRVSRQQRVNGTDTHGMSRFFPHRVFFFSEKAPCMGKQTGNHKMLSILKKCWLVCQVYHCLIWPLLKVPRPSCFCLLWNEIYNGSFLCDLSLVAYAEQHLCCFFWLHLL